MMHGQRNIKSGNLTVNGLWNVYLRGIPTDPICRMDLCSISWDFLVWPQLVDWGLHFNLYTKHSISPSLKQVILYLKAYFWHILLYMLCCTATHFQQLSIWPGKAICSFRTPGSSQPTAQHHISNDWTFNYT